LELARRVLGAGDPRRAASILGELVAEAPAGPLRARARLLVALASEWIEGAEAATDLCEQALADAGEDVELRAEIHAAASRACDHDSRRKLRHARMALDIVRVASPDPQLHASVLLAAVEASFNAGHGIDYDLLGETSRLERLTPRWRPHAYLPLSRQLLANLQLSTDELEPARIEYDWERRLCIERGDETFLARVLTRWATLELRAGNWDLAEENVSEVATIVERTGQRIVRQRCLLLTALLHVLHGRIEPARAVGAEALALATEVGARWNVAESLAALGFVELSAGDLNAAAAHLDGVDEIYRQIGLGEPRLFRYQADHIETLVALGQLERARSALERLEQQGTPVAKPWVDAMATRCRGLLLAAEGDLAGAERSFNQSLGHHRELGLPFELGRTLLCLGRLQRRRKQRKAARETLQQSLDVFEELGAPLWARGARAELDRTHVRQAPHELSPTEQQVARFAASGLKNREIAERMFLSPKTIEANLARVYGKLGIRSRAELGAAMSARSM